MRGADVQPGNLFSYVDLEDRIPESQPHIGIETS